VFRGKFIAGLKSAFRKGQLCLPGELQSLADKKAFQSFLRVLHQHQWVVYAKQPFGGPNHVLNYLARYTHRVAISNHRLLSFSDGKVSFRWKDYAHGSQQKVMTLSAEEFLRRFLLHALPGGFVRIRFFGFMSHRCRSEMLPICKGLIGQKEPATKSEPAAKQPSWLCPHCMGPMVVIWKFTAQELREKSLRQDVVDSS
jgi:hypothetical protein